MKKRIAFLLVVCMALILCACGKKEPVKIASKPMTEQYILTEIIAQLIEAETDYEVEITKGVGGGTTNIHPALVKGEFDLYPEYTRTAWLNVLKKEEMEKDDEKLYQQLLAEYDALGLTWTGLYGFSNTYGLAVRGIQRSSMAFLLIQIWRQHQESLFLGEIRIISNWKPDIADFARHTRCSLRIQSRWKLH